VLLRGHKNGAPGKTPFGTCGGSIRGLFESVVLKGRGVAGMYLEGPDTISLGWFHSSLACCGQAYADGVPYRGRG